MVRIASQPSRRTVRRHIRPSIDALEARALLTNYPDVGAYPIAMNPIPTAPTAAFYQTQESGYNVDGSLTSNPVAGAGTQSVGNIVYVLKKLTTSDSITFKGTPYVVYSAVPQAMTINYAYNNTAHYFDQNELNLGVFDFPSTAPTQINGGAATAYSSTPATSALTNDYVYITQPGTDAGLYIPNLPTTSGNNGLTDNVYWTTDPYIGATGYAPNGAVYHLEPYGWAVDPRTVNSSIFIYDLDAQGLGNSGITFLPANPNNAPAVNPETPFNTWLHLIQGQDKEGSQWWPLLQPGIDSVSTWPFPTPSWTYNGSTTTPAGGIYFPYQAQPGFQSNMVRYYTPPGSWNLVENTAGLFVRNDGTIELPANPTTNSLIPLVTQTWDGAQRFTMLNLLKDQAVPSTVDQYPGSEVYFAGNAYLPGSAGVWTAVKNYTVFDGASSGTGANQLSYRRPDTWLGLAGDSVNDVTRWAEAPVNGNPTEPGGQANKPYITDVSNQLGTYSALVQNANSMMVAELPSSVKDKLYAVTLWVDTGSGYQQVATLSSEWRPWSLASDGTWSSTPWGTGLGSVVPSAFLGSYTPPADLSISITTSIAETSTGQGTWNSAGRTLAWNTVRAYQSGDGNELNAYPQFYSITVTTTNSNYKFLLTLEKLEPASPGPRQGIRAIQQATDRFEGNVDSVVATILSDPTRPNVRSEGRQLIRLAKDYRTQTLGLVRTALASGNLDRDGRLDVLRMRATALRLSARVQLVGSVLSTRRGATTERMLARFLNRRLRSTVNALADRIDALANNL